MSFQKIYPLFILGFASIVAVVAAGCFSVVRAQTAAPGTSAAATTATTSTLQQQLDANNAQIATLNQQIETYQAALKQTGADKKTLQQAINALDLQRKKVQTQVTLTQKQITSTQLQIQQLGGQITDTKTAIATDQAALGASIRILQKADGQTIFMEFLSSGSLTDVLTKTNATLQIQDAVHAKMQAAQQQQTALASSQAASKQKQATLASQKLALASQQESLITTEQSKTQLLADTKSKEANYQKLLAAAQAQLASFSAFAQNAGGSKLLAGQTACDAWGCYYNQRDTAWGGLALNGTQFKLASDGCLVTSMAMVLTHYGYRDVTPATINANPDNFAVYYPAYLLYTINVAGATAMRITAAIDATLATGNPVIAGIHAYGGTHYVVLVSGARGNYVMRDPYVANGKDISFASSYSLRSIFGVTRVQVSG